MAAPLKRSRKSKQKRNLECSDYEVEAIQEKETKIDDETGEPRFRVKWLGFSEKVNTFEPFENLSLCSVFLKFIRDKYELHENQILINQAAMRKELRKEFMQTVRSKPKAVLLEENLPHDPLHFKVLEVVNVLVKHSNKKFKENLKRLTFQNLIFNLEMTQKVRNNELMKLIELEEDASVTIENNEDFELLPKFNYTSSNVLVTPLPEVQRSPADGCCCEGKCSEKTQCCPQQEKLDFPTKITRSGRAIPRNIKCQRMIECGPSCNCDESCMNKLTQKKRDLALCLFKTKNRGWGLRACREIPAKSHVIEYTGELLGPEDEERVSDYLFELDQFEGWFVDAAKFGNLARFINHQCIQPNCHVRYANFRNGGPTQEKIQIFSNRKIRKGEELTIDYTGGQEKTTGTTRCLCAPDCRNFIF